MPTVKNRLSMYEMCIGIEFYTFIQEVCIELIKSDSKDMHSDAKYFYFK